MKRVYVAGPYSAKDIISVLENMKVGIRASVEVLLAGFAPFCPWIDYHFSFATRDNEKITVDDYYNYGLAWLEVSDALLVLPNSENSKGVKMEIDLAKKKNIPIFYDLKILKNYFKVGKV